jgi:hypothetical protein
MDDSSDAALVTVGAQSTYHLAVGKGAESKKVSMIVHSIIDKVGNKHESCAPIV